MKRLLAFLLLLSLFTLTAFDYCNNEACSNEIGTPNEMGYCSDCLAEIVPV